MAAVAVVQQSYRHRERGLRFEPRHGAERDLEALERFSRSVGAEMEVVTSVDEEGVNAMVQELGR